jgi:hypothetical protein
MSHCLNGEPTGDRWVDDWPRTPAPAPPPTCRECGEPLDEDAPYLDFLRCVPCSYAHAWANSSF